MPRLVKLCWPPLAAVAVLLAALTASGGGQDKKHGAKELYNSLREVINTGADLFNLHNDYAGCYRVYHGALLSIKPFVSPELQAEIGRGIANAERMAKMSDRAFELRRVIDLIRNQLRDGPPPPVRDKPLPPKDTGKKSLDKPPPPKDAGKKPPPGKTLWDRLGGEENVARVVDDFVIAAASDPKVNVTRGGKIKVNADDLKVQLIAFISHHTGGPYKYTGKDMKTAHKGMGITDAEFDAAGAHLKKALEKHKAAPADVDALMNSLGAMRKDIVEPGAPNKGGGKKDAPGKEGPRKVEPPETTSRVSGKVTLDGKPLGASYVTFVGSRKFTTFVKDGSYSFRTPIPVGQYRIAIEPENGKGVATVPARYRNVASSGLTFRVEGAEAVIDIALSN